MSATIDSLKAAGPPVGVSLVGWPWWAVALVLVVSCGPFWTMAWLDVIDRLRSEPGGDTPRIDADGAETSVARVP